MNTLIIGTGYIGHRVAKLWRDDGHQVVVSTRSDVRAAEYAREGLRPVVCDVTQPASLQVLPACDVLLYAVGYDRSVPASIQEVYADGFANVLASLYSRPRRIIYVSSTGVYGSAGGDWVDESSPADPQREGGRASLAAEQVLWSSPWADGGFVLRLAGIYGPGRVPYIDRLRAGLPIEAPRDGWLNLIHADDAARIIQNVASAPIAGPRTYNVCDGNPVVRGEYYAEVARLAGTAPPNFVEPAGDSPRAARAAADKQVSNARLAADLRPTLQYPSYREGLAAILS